MAPSHSTRSRHQRVLGGGGVVNSGGASATNRGSQSAPSRRQDTVTTSFLLANLHCPTCVSSIKAAVLQACPDQVSWVSPNVVTSVVTVEHKPGNAATIGRMAKALDDAGFEVVGVTSTETEHVEEVRQLARAADATDAQAQRRANTGLDGAWQRWFRPRSPRSNSNLSPGSAAAQHQPTSSRARTAHLANCEQCRNSKIPQATARFSQIGVPKTDEKQPAVVASSSKAAVDEVTSAPAKKLVSAKSFVTVDDGGDSAEVPEQDVVWRASLAVGGMTCAVCVNAITEELNKRDWISSVAVNLISNSATVEFRNKDNADKVVEVIEDLGYEAHVDKVVGVVDEQRQRSKDAAANEAGATAPERTVDIKIDGFYCEHCPDRVVTSIENGFGRAGNRVEVVGKPTLETPIMKVKYTPDAPAFTVRHLLAAVEAVDPECFRAGVFHAPTLEERSRQLHARHQRQLLVRVIFTAITAIPTFVIGIVYMSLLPADDPGRVFMMMPWTSGISRAQMALFIMATPVYFLAADVFHVRAFKEVRVMWRRGSTVPFLRRFYRFGSMNMLMSLGTTIAYISSLSQLIAAAVYQPEEISNSNFYFDSVVFLTLFLLVGRLIETYSKSRTGDAVEMLGKLRPTTAILVGANPPADPTQQQAQPSEKESAGDAVVAADLLDFGDVVRIPSGSSPPCDGVVLTGSTTFDESSLTGESRPVTKHVGDAVFAGTVNRGGPATARVTGVAGASMLDRIVEVVREGQARRAPMEQVADVLTTYFVPCVTLIAVLTWVIWLSLGLTGKVPEHFLDVTSGGWVAFSLQFAIAVFVVACPCGLALAAPTAIFVGGGLAAQHGILAKGGGEAFEKASKVDVVVFDKTGTLTEGGAPKITDDRFLGAFEDELDNHEQRNALLAALKAIEENSSHPIAKAIVAFCSERATSAATVTLGDVEEIPGKGMKATVGTTDDKSSDGDGPAAVELLVGNEALLRDHHVAVPAEVDTLLAAWKDEAKSVALVATRFFVADAAQENPPSSSSSSASAPTATASQPFALSLALAISDPIRAESAPVVAALQRAGVRVWMLSGDSEATARAVAARVGIPADQVIAGVLPTEKADKVAYLQRSLKARVGGRGEHATRRATVAMVGDGINDAPALTTADVGVAIGSGSDVAIGSAGFVLVKSDLRAVPLLLDLSRAVFGRVRLNFAWALVYNLVAVPVAAGALYPVKTASGQHVRLDPVWASLAMALSSISVVLSSLALRSPVPGLGFRAGKVVVPGED